MKMTLVEEMEVMGNFRNRMGVGHLLISLLRISYLDPTQLMAQNGFQVIDTHSSAFQQNLRLSVKK